MELHGVIPPMLTPVGGRDGGVDRAATRELAGALVAGGVHGLFPCGTNGEFASLDRADRRAALEATVDAAGDVPVLAGCGDTGIRRTLALIDDADAAGADAAVVVTPYYMPADQGGLREYYERVADASALPVVLYDIPSLTGQRLEPETVAALAEHDGIVGIKDSGGHLAHFYRLLEGTPEGFAVLQGSTAYAVQSLDMGADGFVSGGANAFPGLLAALYDAHAAGDRERAVSLLAEAVFPLIGAITSMPGIPAIKHLAALSGHEVGPPVAPLPRLTAEQEARLAERHALIRARFDG